MRNIYINIINNRLVLKIKDEYKLELKKVRNLKKKTKKLTIKNDKNVASLEVVEVVSVQFYLVDNQY